MWDHFSHFPCFAKEIKPSFITYTQIAINHVIPTLRTQHEHGFRPCACVCFHCFYGASFWGRPTKREAYQTLVFCNWLPQWCRPGRGVCSSWGQEAPVSVSRVYHKRQVRWQVFKAWVRSFHLVDLT
jgi:hypothetical protein